MSIEDEMHVYNEAEVSPLTGETESYDVAFFPAVIRRIVVNMIMQVLEENHPTLILDYGCGGGWLSKHLEKQRYHFIGIDISRSMIKNAKKVCPASDFLVCDATRLPFIENVFDFVIGISILHHLDLRRATAELKRVSKVTSVLLFEDPNSLNPLSAFGRKLFPMEAHTKGETQFTPEYMRTALELANFDVKKCFTVFFLTFPLARLSKIVGLHPPLLLVKLTYFLEGVLEKMPGIRYLNASIVVIAKSNS